MKDNLTKYGIGIGSWKIHKKTRKQSMTEKKQDEMGSEMKAKIRQTESFLKYSYPVMQKTKQLGMLKVTILEGMRKTEIQFVNKLYLSVVLSN
jgi:hypothetical protein